MVLTDPDSPSSSTPTHVAIIMDGNGRWARSRGLPRTIGHRYGVEAVRRAVKAATDLGISYLTLFGFSSENWKRPVAEITDLMGLLRRYLQSEIADLHKNGVRLRIIGEREGLAPDIVTLIDNAESSTAGNTALTLTIALNYGSRREIALAARALAIDAVAGKLDPNGIDETLFGARLATAGMPDPDLLIRTSGEQRVSNFLLWQSAYTELVFLDILWPDFNAHHLEDAVREFSKRERRYGASSG